MPSASRASLRPISWVAIDLTLTTSRLAGRLHQVGDDPVGLVGVGGPVHGAARRRDRLLQLDQIAVEMAQRVVLDLLAGLAQLGPVGQLGDGLGPLGADGVGGVAQIAAQRCSLRTASWAALGKAGIPTNVPLMRRRLLLACSPGSRRCAPAACAVPWPAHGAADVHQAGVVGARTAPRRRSTSALRTLSAPIAAETSGFFTREGAAEAAALLGARQLAQLQALDRLRAAAAAGRRGPAPRRPWQVG